ncbi:MAG: TraR/DksA C4-type zinc finger protein [Gemmatimonadetes bacterium]|nr:TraR/DksA C4-type zinc finger protein [Gemmatimonadota bacterium]
MLTSEERDRIEKLLLREREQALEALGHFEERADDLRERSGEISLYRFHMADIGTEAQEQEKDFLLASNEGRRLYEVDEALRKLYKTPEDFGKCERCGQPIGFARLEVIPQARHCANCQALLEQA